MKNFIAMKDIKVTFFKKKMKPTVYTLQVADGRNNPYIHTYLLTQLLTYSPRYNMYLQAKTFLKLTERGVPKFL